MSEDEVISALVEVDRLRARLDGIASGLVGEFDRRCTWAADGARDAAGWLTARTDVSAAGARAEVRLARALRRMPVTLAAVREGRLGRDKVRTLASAYQEGLEDALAQDEAALVGEVETLTVAGAWRLVRRWIDSTRARLGLNPPDGPEPTHGQGASKATLATGLEGRWFGTLDLTGEDGEVLATAIDDQIAAFWDTGVFHAADGLCTAERRARALVEVVTRGTRGGGDDATARPLVMGLVDLPTLLALGNQTDETDGSPASPTEQAILRLSELSRSGPVSVATLRRLACEGDIVPVVVGAGGTPLAMGRRVRIATRAQRRALRVRDQHCAFAGCTTPAERCIAHHLTYWEDGGPTDLDNLALLCRHHHRLVHDQGFRLHRDDDGTLRTYRPDGRPIDPGRTDRPALLAPRPPPRPDRDDSHPDLADPDPQTVAETRRHHRHRTHRATPARRGHDADRTTPSG